MDKRISLETSDCLQFSNLRIVKENEYVEKFPVFLQKEASILNQTGNEFKLNSKKINIFSIHENSAFSLRFKNVSNYRKPKSEEVKSLEAKINQSKERILHEIISLVPLLQKLNRKEEPKLLSQNNFKIEIVESINKGLGASNCLSFFNSFQNFNRKGSNSSDNFGIDLNLKARKNLNSFSSLETSDSSETHEKISHKISKNSEISDEDRLSLKCCNCKKSRCLKLYCECFAAGKTCVGDCACVECLNSDENNPKRKLAISAILTKHPDAFSSKIVKSNNFQIHKLGCNCKKSGCSKKYCECFNSGVSCTSSCKCEGCANCEESNSQKKTKLETMQRNLSTIENLQSLSLPDRILRIMETV